MKATYEWEKLEFTPLYERWSKSRLDRLIRKLDSGLPTDSFIGRGRIRATFFENSQLIWDVHVRIHVAPLAYYAFI